MLEIIHIFTQSFPRHEVVHLLSYFFYFLSFPTSTYKFSWSEGVTHLLSTTPPTTKLAHNIYQILKLCTFFFISKLFRVSHIKTWIFIYSFALCFIMKKFYIIFIASCVSNFMFKILVLFCPISDSGVTFK